MIKITKKYKNKTIEQINISGHANFANLGNDIVCAAVSSIVTTTINGILRIDFNSIEYNQKGANIVIKRLNKNADLLLDNMLDLLKQIEKEYPKNITIK